MATNPNVPTDAKVAAETSAPNATVTAQQPAQLPTGTQAAPATAAPGLTAQPVTAPQAAAARPVAPQPVQGAKMAEPAKVDDKAATDRKAEVSKEQSTLKSVMSEAEGKDYFEQQEVFGKAFEEREGEDSFRRAARIEREREALLSAGDPTKDPVAKQKAMDLNFVAPGAVADAQKIKDIGAEKLAEQSPAHKGVK